MEPQLPLAIKFVPLIVSVLFGASFAGIAYVARKDKWVLVRGGYRDGNPEHALENRNLVRMFWLLAGISLLVGVLLTRYLLIHY